MRFRWCWATGAMGALLLLGCSKASTERTVSWNVSRPIVDADQTIPVSMLRGSCDTFERTTADETADEVRITVYVRHKGQACDAVGWIQAVDVELAAPIGTRKLIGCVPEGECRTQTGPPYAAGPPSPTSP